MNVSFDDFLNAPPYGWDRRTLRSKRVKGSSLEKIPGVGEKRRAELLKRFHTVSAVAAASLQELQTVLPRDAAAAVYSYFHGEGSAPQ